MKKLLLSVLVLFAVVQAAQLPPTQQSQPPISPLFLQSFDWYGFNETMKTIKNITDESKDQSLIEQEINHLPYDYMKLIADIYTNFKNSTYQVDKDPKVPDLNEEEPVRYETILRILQDPHSFDQLKTKKLTEFIEEYKASLKDKGFGQKYIVDKLADMKRRREFSNDIYAGIPHGSWYQKLKKKLHIFDMLNNTDSAISFLKNNSLRVIYPLREQYELCLRQSLPTPIRRFQPFRFKNIEKCLKEIYESNKLFYDDIVDKYHKDLLNLNDEAIGKLTFSILHR